MRWAVGVTTSPRDEPTLDRCLASLAAAGWGVPRVFAEPGVDLPARFSRLPATRRDEVLGAFPNWFLGLAELVMREPRADVYFMCQDDVIFARGLRAFLDRYLWPAPRVGAVSVYCPSHYALDKGPGFHREDRGWKTWGALTLLFPNPSARALIAHPAVVSHRHHGPRGGMRNIDSVVGHWCRLSGLPFFVHTPSLAQHVGETSTLYAHAAVQGKRRAGDFVGEQADVSADFS